MRLEEFLSRDDSVDHFGGWAWPTADIARWTMADTSIRSLELIVHSFVWQSEAQYSEVDLYIGRAPSLLIDGDVNDFENAVRFAARLGQASKWMKL